MAVTNGFELVGSDLFIVADGTRVAKFNPTVISILSGVTLDAATLQAGGSAVAAGAQVSNIEDVTGGSTTDTNARTTIASIIDALEAFGISATA